MSEQRGNSDQAKGPIRGFECRMCGQRHSELPLHYGAEAPALYFTIPAPERGNRCELTCDVCMIDSKHWFIVGDLEIPIFGSEERFSWDVWVSLSETNMKRAALLWESPSRVSEPPYFGWLSTVLQGYPDTLHLKTNVHSREVGRRPYIELEPTDHPLAIEQRNGITWERVQMIAEMVPHGQPL